MTEIPRRNGDQWLVRWHDDGVLREVNAKFRRETWTQYDPELVERNHLPQDQRLDLKAPIKEVIDGEIIGEGGLLK